MPKEYKLSKESKIENWITSKNEYTGVEETVDYVTKERVFNEDERKARKLLDEIVDREVADPVKDRETMTKALANGGIYLTEIAKEYADPEDPDKAIELLNIASSAVQGFLAERQSKTLSFTELVSAMKFLHNVFMQLEVMPTPKDLTRTSMQTMFLASVQRGGFVNFLQDNLATLNKLPKDQKKGQAETGPQAKDVLFRIVSMAIDRSKDCERIDDEERTSDQRAVLALVNQLSESIDELPPAFSQKIRSRLGGF